jgi:hypothetical protein
MGRGRRACVALLALVCAVGMPDQSEGASTTPSDAFPARPFAAAEPPLGAEHLEVGGALTGLPAYSEAPGALHQDAPQVTGRWTYAEGSRAPTEGAPRVTDVELISPHRLPEDRVRAAIGLVGQPRSRSAVRESLTRLWALGLFSEVRVEEVDVPDGVRLRYHLARRPHLRALHWTGDLGIDVAWLTAAVGLALGEDVDADRLAQARESLLALYRREGYFGARVAIETTSDPETNGRDVTIAVGAGEPARVGEIRARGPNGEARRVLAVLGLETGDRYRETVVRERVRAAEERLRKDGWFEARVTAGSPTWDPVTNRVDHERPAVPGRVLRQHGALGRPPPGAPHISGERRRRRRRDRGDDPSAGGGLPRARLSLRRGDRRRGPGRRRPGDPVPGPRRAAGRGGLRRLHREPDRLRGASRG